MTIAESIKQFIGDSIKSLFEQQKTDLHAMTSQEVNAAVDAIRQQLVAAERDRANLQQMVFSLNQSMTSLMAICQQLQHQDEQMVERLQRLSELLPDSSPQMEEPCQAKVPQTLYAQMVDSLDPLGFTNATLSTNKETGVFQITMNDECHGTYEFIDDEIIRHDVLAAFNPYITDSSVFNHVPQNPEVVIVEEAGEVERVGNMLQITKKQKINFKEQTEL